MLRKLVQKGFSSLQALQGIKKFNPNQIPENLIVDRQMEQTTLSNGINVYTEYWPSQLSHITIFIKCGSRNENEETSGTAHFLEHLHFKGTGRRKREKLEVDVENFGGQLNAYTARENTSYTLNFFNENVDKATEVLGDMLTNSLYSNAAVENERDTIYRELIETRKMQFETTIEISHRGTYKNHQMSLPILGKIQNMYSISREMIVNYHKANYYGSNLIVVGGGGINHQQLCDLIEKNFSKLRTKPEIKPNLPQKPKFQNEVFIMESELTNDLNISIFYEAPEWTSPKYYDFLILQRLLADRPENIMEAQIYYSNPFEYLYIQIQKDSNLNLFQKNQLKCQNIYQQKAVYTPYMDTGMFGNYFIADPEKGIEESIQLTKETFLSYAQNINEEELQRAKRRLYIELCQHETGNDITQAIANQILYFDRRLYRQEIAQNIAKLTVEDIQETVKEWLVDKPYSLTLWGNIKPIIHLYGQDKLGTH